MPRLFPDNRVIYNTILFAYPRDFRQRFGSEMLSTFSDQLSEEWDQHGVRGALRVWRSATAELFSVAVPLHLRSPTAAAMAVSFLMSLAVFMAIFRAVSFQCSK